MTDNFCLELFLGGDLVVDLVDIELGRLEEENTVTEDNSKIDFLRNKLLITNFVMAEELKLEIEHKENNIAAPVVINKLNLVLTQKFDLIKHFKECLDVKEFERLNDYFNIIFDIICDRYEGRNQHPIEYYDLKTYVFNKKTYIEDLVSTIKLLVKYRDGTKFIGFDYVYCEYKNLQTLRNSPHAVSMIKMLCIMSVYEHLNTRTPLIDVLNNYGYTTRKSKIFVRYRLGYTLARLVCDRLDGVLDRTPRLDKFVKHILYMYNNNYLSSKGISGITRFIYPTEARSILKWIHLFINNLNYHTVIEKIKPILHIFKDNELIKALKISNINICYNGELCSLYEVFQWEKIIMNETKSNNYDKEKIVITNKIKEFMTTPLLDMLLSYLGVAPGSSDSYKKVRPLDSGENIIKFKDLNSLNDNEITQFFKARKVLPGICIPKARTFVIEGVKITLDDKYNTIIKKFALGKTISGGTFKYTVLENFPKPIGDFTIPTELANVLNINETLTIKNETDIEYKFEWNNCPGITIKIDKDILFKHRNGKTKYVNNYSEYTQLKVGSYSYKLDKYNGLSAIKVYRNVNNYLAIGYKDLNNIHKFIELETVAVNNEMFNECGSSTFVNKKSLEDKDIYVTRKIMFRIFYLIDKMTKNTRTENIDNVLVINAFRFVLNYLLENDKKIYDALTNYINILQSNSPEDVFKTRFATLMKLNNVDANRAIKLRDSIVNVLPYAKSLCKNVIEQNIKLLINKYT